MRRLSRAASIFASLALLGLVIAGCGKDDSNSDNTSDDADANVVAASPNAKKKSFQPIDFGKGGGTGKTTVQLTPEQKLEAVRKALYPLQIMTGEWEGQTRKKFGAAAISKGGWRWDYSDKSQPALVHTSAKSPYIRDARLTYLVDKKRYRFTMTNAEGVKKTFEGDFSVPVHDELGDDDRLQRTYKLQLRQVDAPDEKNVWQIVFNQQDNNRYLLELNKQRPSTGKFDMLIDVVGTQRLGTSFALSDYGEKTCIVSQGLGTIAVSHAGKTYWVCCTGCKAAFEDEPERWLAAAEKRKKEK